jgi:putative FmdB family regulatory protein
MPTYQYVCRDCGHELEVWQSMQDAALTICPECGGSLRKVFAPPAISFKGSGFYATDHGKRSKPSERADGAEPSAPKKKGESEKGSSTTDRPSSGSDGGDSAKPNKPKEGASS